MAGPHEIGSGTSQAGAQIIQLRPGTGDAETVTVIAGEIGGPVDEVDERATVYGKVTGSAQADRQPIVPAWARNSQQRRQVVADAARLVGYQAGYHTTRSPKYTAKILWWAPIGVFVGLWRIGRWVFDSEGRPIRHNAVSRNDVEGYLKLSRQRDQRIRARLLVAVPAAVLLTVGIVLLTLLAPWWIKWLVLAAALPPLAVLGRPVDKPIVDRTVTLPRFTRLTAEQVRTALIAISVGIKDPVDVSFPPPGIHRDGPGWLARVDLKAGVTAVKVMERREELSSALRLPVDQVWPESGPDHAGQLDLWVGYKPASQMGRPRWELVSPVARASVFDPIPFATDHRLRPVSTTLFQRNYLIGGQPGSGKTFAGRALGLGALLDPTAELWLAAFKPSEDFYDLSPFCSRYLCGVDDATMQDAEQMVADGLHEVRRRQALLGKLKREGLITEGRTNPDLAGQGIGLHPLILIFDEVHELFLESKLAIADMIRLIKQGRSAFVTVVLITQVASKDSVPPEITRCVSSRWCLSVSDHVANDQIMGTGAYKRGQTGTVYRPRVDAGWGVTSGMSDDFDGPACAYYPNDDELAILLDRIRTVRSGVTFPSTQSAPPRDVLADVRGVFYAGEAWVSWQALAGRLAEYLPEHYADLTPEIISAQVRTFNVNSTNGKQGTQVLKGAKLAELMQAIERRQIGAPR